MVPSVSPGRTEYGKNLCDFAAFASEVDAAVAELLEVSSTSRGAAAAGAGRARDEAGADSTLSGGVVTSAGWAGATDGEVSCASAGAAISTVRRRRRATRGDEELRWCIATAARIEEYAWATRLYRLVDPHASVNAKCNSSHGF